MKPEYDKFAGSGDRRSASFRKQLKVSFKVFNPFTKDTLNKIKNDIAYDAVNAALEKLKEIGTPPFNFIIPDDETIKKINKQNEKWLQDFINSRSK